MVPVMWEQRSKLLNETKELKYTHKIVNLLSQQNSPALVYNNRFSVTLSMFQISEINFSLPQSHFSLCPISDFSTVRKTLHPFWYVYQRF